MNMDSFKESFPLLYSRQFPGRRFFIRLAVFPNLRLGGKRRHMGGKRGLGPRPDTVFVRIQLQ